MCEKKCVSAWSCEAQQIVRSSRTIVVVFHLFLKSRGKMKRLAYRVSIRRVCVCVCVCLFVHVGWMGFVFTQLAASQKDGRTDERIDPHTCFPFFQSMYACVQSKGSKVDLEMRRTMEFSFDCMLTSTYVRTWVLKVSSYYLITASGYAVHNSKTG